MNRFNWQNVTRRISTWCGVASASATAAAGAFIVMPPEWRASFPGWAGAAFAAIAIVSAALVPVATSYNQRSLAADDTDTAGA